MAVDTLEAIMKFERFVRQDLRQAEDSNSYTRKNRYVPREAIDIKSDNTSKYRDKVISS